MSKYERIRDILLVFMEARMKKYGEVNVVDLRKDFENSGLNSLGDGFYTPLHWAIGKLGYYKLTENPMILVEKKPSLIKTEDKYDIFDFKIGHRPSGKKVVELHIKLQFDGVGGIPRKYFLGFLTKENIDNINKLYGEL